MISLWKDGCFFFLIAYNLALVIHSNAQTTVTSLVISHTHTPYPLLSSHSLAPLFYHCYKLILFECNFCFMNPNTTKKLKT